MSKVTVVPNDHLIIVNGESIIFDEPFEAPNIHALQWDETHGHIELLNSDNIILDLSNYQEKVVPFIEIWEAEKIRIEKREADSALPNAKTFKISEIWEAYNAALTASLTMPISTPTTQDVAVGAALFAIDDPEGLTFIQEIHMKRRDELLEAVDTAQTIEEINSIVISFNI